MGTGSAMELADTARPFQTIELVAAGAVAAAAARWQPSRVPLVASALLLFAVSLCHRSRSIRWQSAKACVVLGLAALVSVRSDAAMRQRIAVPRRLSFHAVLRSDPTQSGGVTSAVVSIGEQRFRATARGKAAVALGARSAGDHVTGVGAIRVPFDRSWRIAKHLSGDLSVTTIRAWSQGSAIARFSNAIRRTLLTSSEHFGRTNRALFAGFVLGDPRGQPVWVTDDFRAAGLTHLLVVSGQNVAFTLAVVEPVLRRFRRSVRFVVTVGVLGLFASVTRFEPSVMRAVVMAAFASGALTGGRPQRSLRVLALTVCALMVYDPFLAWSVGFGLSVGACIGLAVVTPRLEPLLPGPRWLATPLATTLGAQTGTSLIMIPLFGGIPVVSIVANLFALPAAEPVMSWGIAVGVPTGLLRRWLGTWPSHVAQLPTEACLWWVRGIARYAAQVPLGEIQSAHMVLLVVAAVVATRIRRARKMLPWCLVGVCAVPTLGAAAKAPPLEIAVAPGVTAYGIGGRTQRRASIVVLDHGTQTQDVLQGLRRSRVRSIDLLVVRSGGRPQADVVTAIAERLDVAEVLVGDRVFAGHVRPLIVARPGMLIVASHQQLRVEAATGGRLAVTVR